MIRHDCYPFFLKRHEIDVTFLHPKLVEVDYKVISGRAFRGHCNSYPVGFNGKLNSQRKTMFGTEKKTFY